MLDNLRIQHLAIIDDCDLHFNEGFTVITGESGAGKSILIDAIELLSGKQASDDYIHYEKDTAFVEATFDIPYTNKQISFNTTEGDHTNHF